MPYLGIDGGGTKTKFMLIDNQGSILSYLKEDTIDYKRIGKDKFKNRIKRSINQIIKDSIINLKDIEYSFWGIPCYGDELTKQEEKHIDQIIGDILKNENYKLGNDVEAGWAGSLVCKPGINLVAGTGAIGFGKDSQGNKARASGWGHRIGDEGSAFWLGEKLLNNFTKQSDGRQEKTLLYTLVREKLSLKNDFEIINLVTSENNFGRKEIANLALILYKAAQNGDKKAIRIYKQAAFELSQVVKTVYSKLEFNESKKVTVTYSGGVFKSGNLILKPLRNYLGELYLELKSPELKPVTGAALYAFFLNDDKISNNDKISSEKLVNKLKKEEGDVLIDD
ncbi:MAG: BadF/BadG/BcrA/BcrD ATPase family protein [Halanaerobiales bacterium]|nr:BadF/BadG/BcrA/BcrD ATPase family protein [Halanaerobiales bacterium]